MTLYETIILAIALSVDATIVSFSQGMIYKQKRVKLALTLALYFGFFQALMTLIGSFVTTFVYRVLQNFSHYIIFGIFIILGSKFILEACQKKEESYEYKCISHLCILVFALATSIDALGAGISLRLLNVDILFPTIIIGMITFINSLIGFKIADIFTKFNSKSIEIMGGILLILLAIRFLLY